MMLYSFSQVCSAMLYLSICTSSIFNTQHVALHRNMVVKHAQTLLQYVPLICCDRLSRRGLQNPGPMLQYVVLQCSDLVGA